MRTGRALLSEILSAHSYYLNRPLFFFLSRTSRRWHAQIHATKLTIGNDILTRDITVACVFTYYVSFFFGGGAGGGAMAKLFIIDYTRCTSEIFN